MQKNMKHKQHQFKCNFYCTCCMSKQTNSSNSTFNNNHSTKFFHKAQNCLPCAHNSFTVLLKFKNVQPLLQQGKITPSMHLLSLLCTRAQTHREIVQFKTEPRHTTSILVLHFLLYTIYITTYHMPE